MSPALCELAGHTVKQTQQVVRGKMEALPRGQADAG